MYDCLDGRFIFSVAFHFTTPPVSPWKPEKKMEVSRPKLKKKRRTLSDDVTNNFMDFQFSGWTGIGLGFRLTYEMGTSNRLEHEYERGLWIAIHRDRVSIPTCPYSSLFFDNTIVHGDGENGNWISHRTMLQPQYQYHLYPHLYPHLHPLLLKKLFPRNYFPRMCLRCENILIL